MLQMFMLWGAALIGHWVALLGGAGVSVALLIYSYNYPDAKIPPLIWWLGIALGFVVASYLTWRKEHDRANALTVNRPEFSIRYAGLEASFDITGKPNPNRYGIRFWFHNKGGVPATRVVRKLLVIVDFNAPPVSIDHAENSNEVYEDFNLRSDAVIPPNAPVHYFVILLRYRDARTGLDHHQEFFFLWRGSTDEGFPMAFQEATIAQADQMRGYMKKRNLYG